MAAASVFICHAQPDADFAQALAIALEICRLSVWRDSRHLRGGDRLTPEVRWAIEQARQVIVVLSVHTGEAAWMRREIELAQEMERRRGGAYRVVPLLLPGMEHLGLGSWFSIPPPTAPIELPVEGLGAALPALLAALHQALPGELAGASASAPAPELELTFSAADASSADARRFSARLQLPDAGRAPENASGAFESLPQSFPSHLLHWYLDDHLRWPIDTVRQVAQRLETLIGNWGHDLYRTLLESPAMAALTAAWRNAKGSDERRLTLRLDPPQSDLATLMDLPWEWLGDATGFLIQDQPPLRVQRQLDGGVGVFALAPPPLRVLTLAPRPDGEPTSPADARRGALALLEGLVELGDLIEVRALTPPTLAALEQELRHAASVGRPYIAVHVDGRFQPNPDPAGSPLFAFEAPAEETPSLYRHAHFVPIETLAAPLAAHHIRLAVLTGPRAAPGAVRPTELASALLKAKLAGVIVVRPNAPAETLRRLWSACYEELLRGARLGQAFFTSQRRLASDSYRGPGLGGGNVNLRDWPVAALYLGSQDPRLALRPASALWRRLASQPQRSPSRALPALPATGCLGRSRELLIVERLLESRPAVFIKGCGGSGKTTLATELTHWLTRLDRYRHTAYVHADEASDPRALLETLGRQLLPAGERWSVGQHPGLRQALDYFRQALRPHPTLIVLDQIERWSAEHDEEFDQFWKNLADEWPALRLVALGRIGPPFFAQPWIEMKLAALDETDAVALINQTLIATAEAPPAADSGDGFRQLRQLAALAGGHPGALLSLAREISARGVQASLTLLRPLRDELLERYPNDRQWPLYLALELNLRRLSPKDRDSLAVLAFFKDGANRIALEHALDLSAPAVDALCERLIALGLAEDRGHGHLRFDSALALYLAGQLNSEQRTIWRERWQTSMERWLAELYQLHFRDSVRAQRLLKLELANLLALLRGSQQHMPAERTARMTSQLEQLLASFGMNVALTEAAAARERAGRALRGWSRERFETERLKIERLRDDGALEDALQAAREIVRQCGDAGADAYPGAAYDQARAHFQLGKLLKTAKAAAPAARELTEACRQFQELADAGNASAARMASVASAEAGDCLSDLRQLQDAAAAYEAALALSGSNVANPTVAANQFHLGLVRQRQEQYAAAAAQYEAARRTCETLGDLEGVAQAWRQISLARKLNGEMELALRACQQALYLYEQQRHRTGVAEVLGELGHLHQILEQLEEAVRAYRRMAELYLELGDGRGEQASRNKLANVLIQLRRHDEARQELYRASECDLPESPTARHWAIRRGLRDVGQTAEDAQVADQARRQAIQKYLAYRRAGGENNNPGIQLCAQIRQAIRAGDTAPLIPKLAQAMASPNVPSGGKLLIGKLQAILAGARDPALTDDPDLHYQYAAELQLLLEDLAESTIGKLNGAVKPKP